MTPAGIEPATFRLVAQHLSHCATAVPVLLGIILVLTRLRMAEERAEIYSIHVRVTDQVEINPCCVSLIIFYLNDHYY